jgi:predicted dehydrogenase
VGRIKTIQASNCQDTKAPNIRLSAALGGGPVGDVGVYCINGACWATGEQPKFVSAVAHWPNDDPRFSEVPESVSFMLEFPSGIQATCECGFGSSVSRRFRILGDKGFLEMDPAYAYRGLELRVKRGDDERGTAELATLAIPQKNHFAEEMDGFSRAVLDGAQPRTPGSMGLADVRTVAAVMEAARSGKRIEVT